MKTKYLCSLLLGGAVALSSTAFAAHKANPDATFVKKASAGGLTEVALGQLATTNGGSQDVKDFGAKMVTDHTKLNDGLKAAADKSSLAVSDKPTADQQAMIDSLGKKTGKAFDKAYIAAMVKAHVGDKAAFTEENANTTNPDLKQATGDALPVIKEHLAMIKDIAAGKKPSTAMDMNATGNQGKSAMAPQNLAPVGSGPDATAPAASSMPNSGDSGQSKSGLAPGSTANPTGSQPQ